MNDIEKLREYAAPLWEKRLEEKQNQVEAFFQKHQEEIIRDFCNSIIENLLSDTAYKQEEGEQEEVLFLGISYLHSSLVTGTYEYEINLFNQLLFADEKRKSMYWHLYFLYQNIEEDEAFLQKELRKRFVRVESHEVEVLRRLFISYYWRVGLKYFKVLGDALIKDLEVKKWAGERQFVILYGEHMGELEEIL